MVHLKSIRELIWGPFGVCFGINFGPSEVHFGVHFGSMLRSDSDSGLRPPRDQISRPLGPILALLLDPMLAPCRLHVGGGRASWGVLGRFWTDLKAIRSSILINMEKETKRRGWMFEKTFKYCVFQCFLKVSKIAFG